MAITRRRLLRKIKNWAVPLFYSLTTLLILVFNDVFGDVDEFIFFSLIFFVSMFIVFCRWVFIQTKFILQLRKEKKQAELLHLKSQVNPHFFFNTLNNLYGLVEQDTTKAKELILKLSDMMRYSIYEGQNDRVSLGEEVEYLQNYIELHKMRYHKNIDIQFDVDVDNQEVKVMPLLFIILLENAFKHGVEHLRKNAFVSIQLKATARMIDFAIENNFDAEEVSAKPGIGLANLKRRLELVYPDQYKLETEAKEERYKAKLSLQL